MFDNLFFFDLAPLATNLIRPYSSVKKVPIRLDSLKLAECNNIALDEKRDCFKIYLYVIYQKKREAVKPP